MFASDSSDNDDDCHHPYVDTQPKHSQQHKWAVQKPIDHHPRRHCHFPHFPPVEGVVTTIRDHSRRQQFARQTMSEENKQLRDARANDERRRKLLEEENRRLYRTCLELAKNREVSPVPMLMPSENYQEQADDGEGSGTRVKERTVSTTSASEFVAERRRQFKRQQQPLLSRRSSDMHTKSSQPMPPSAPTFELLITHRQLSQLESRRDENERKRMESQHASRCSIDQDVSKDVRVSEDLDEAREAHSEANSRSDSCFSQTAADVQLHKSQSTGRATPHASGSGNYSISPSKSYSFREIKNNVEGFDEAKREESVCLDDERYNESSDPAEEASLIEPCFVADNTAIERPNRIENSAVLASDEHLDDRNEPLPELSLSASNVVHTACSLHQNATANDELDSETPAPESYGESSHHSSETQMPFGLHERSNLSRVNQLPNGPPGGVSTNRAPRDTDIFCDTNERVIEHHHHYHAVTPRTVDLESEMIALMNEVDNLKLQRHHLHQQLCSNGTSPSHTEITTSTNTTTVISNSTLCDIALSEPTQDNPTVAIPTSTEHKNQSVSAGARTHHNITNELSSDYQEYIERIETENRRLKDDVRVMEDELQLLTQQVSDLTQQEGQLRTQVEQQTEQLVQQEQRERNQIIYSAVHLGMI